MNKDQQTMILEYCLKLCCKEGMRLTSDPKSSDSEVAKNAAATHTLMLNIRGLLGPGKKRDELDVLIDNGREVLKGLQSAMEG